MTTSGPLKTFIIYAREDTLTLVELKKSLNLLELCGQISVWYDGEIIAGQEWGKAIKTQLETADIILLLLSNDFFNSEYIEKKEFREALTRHGLGESVVVPIVARHCSWQEHPEIEKLQILPDNAAPISSKKHWEGSAEACTNVAAGIARIAIDLHGQREKIAREKEEAEARRLAAERRARDPFHDLMVRVEGGTFQMGSNENGYEKPIHTVTVPTFFIGKYLVTQGQWQKIMGNNPNHITGNDNLPVEYESWNDVQEFLKKLNDLTGQQYRLPSEAEWEYAARGGKLSKGYKFSGSNYLGKVGWYSANSDSKTHPVGQLSANELGLHDMSGNVWEMCEDNWHWNYNHAPNNGLAWIDKPKIGEWRVIRGGSCSGDAVYCRAAVRFWCEPVTHHYECGFRLALSI